MRAYISYAPVDAPLARELAGRLAEDGVEAWFPDRYLFPGDNWGLEIGKALEEAEAMIVLVSPEAAQSEWVRNDISYALGSLRYEDRLIPVVVRATEGMPGILRTFPQVPGDRGVEEIRRRVVEWLRDASGVSP